MVYVIADIHGSALSLQQDMKYMPELTEDDYIIIAGDAGLEYGPYSMGSLKKYMKKLPCTFVVMRGNHDNRYHYMARNNPDRWSFTDDGMYAYENKYPNIMYVKDIGGVYTIDGKDILFIPGAYSVDKYYRLANGLAYEPREELSWFEADNLFEEIDSKHFDYVISHTAPLSLVPKLEHLFLAQVDQGSVSHWTEKICDEVYTNYSFKHWYFGHFHSDMELSDNVTMVYAGFGVIGNDE